MSSTSFCIFAFAMYEFWLHSACFTVEHMDMCGQAAGMAAWLVRQQQAAMQQLQPQTEEQQLLLRQQMEEQQQPRP